MSTMFIDSDEEYSIKERHDGHQPFIATIHRNAAHFLDGLQTKKDSQRGLAEKQQGE